MSGGALTLLMHGGVGSDWGLIGRGLQSQQESDLWEKTLNHVKAVFRRFSRGAVPLT